MFFMYSLINWFEDGDIIRQVFSGALKFLVAISGLGALYLFGKFWTYIGQFGFFGFIGLVLFQVTFVLGAYMVLHAVWVRSNTIKDLSTGSYTVIPIMSTLSRMAGEVYAILSGVIGVGGFFMILFVGSSYRHAPGPFRFFLYDLLPFNPRMFMQMGGGDLSVAFVFLVSMVLTGLLLIIWFYFIAELLIVLIDIANNTSNLGSKE